MQVENIKKNCKLIMKIKFNKSLENAMKIAGAELKFTYNLVNQNQNVVSTKKKFNKDGLLKNTKGIKLLNYGGLIFLIRFF